MGRHVLPDLVTQENSRFTPYERAIWHALSQVRSICQLDDRMNRVKALDSLAEFTSVRLVSAPPSNFLGSGASTGLWLRGVRTYRYVDTPP